ncbi:MAG: hypothetical protein ABL974_13485 [Prosthecobacter sp.]
MKTVTVRDLRCDFPKIEAMLASGQEIQITKHSKPIATIMKVKPAAKKAMPPLPDFKARIKKIWGDRVFSAQEVEEMRVFETGEPCRLS